jgi:hypothetical protein
MLWLYAAAIAGLDNTPLKVGESLRMIRLPLMASWNRGSTIEYGA